MTCADAPLLLVLGGLLSGLVLAGFAALFLASWPSRLSRRVGRDR